MRAVRKHVGAVQQKRIDRLIAVREIEQSYETARVDDVDVEGLSGFELDEVPEDAVRLDWIPVSKNDILRPVVSHRGDGTAYARLIRTEKANKWEQYAKRVLRAAYGPNPLTGPVRVRHWIAFADRRRRDGPNPDELLYDAMEGVVYENDVQIVDWRGRKAVAPELEDHVMWVTVEGV